MQASRPGRTRTRDKGIMSQQVTPVNPRENGTFSNCAAPGAAVELENVPIDPDLQAIIARWSELPEALKAGIMAMVRVTDRD